MATNLCVIMPLNKLLRGSVALVVTTMFLGVSHAGERGEYIPACQTEFIKAWNAWDPITLTSAAKKMEGVWPIKSSPV